MNSISCPFSRVENIIYAYQLLEMYHISSYHWLIKFIYFYSYAKQNTNHCHLSTQISNQYNLFFWRKLSSITSKLPSRAQMDMNMNMVFLHAIRWSVKVSYQFHLVDVAEKCHFVPIIFISFLLSTWQHDFQEIFASIFCIKASYIPPHCSIKYQNQLIFPRKLDCNQYTDFVKENNIKILECR